MGLVGVVFDLDDTLFLERDYVSSGFRAVGRLLLGIVSATVLIAMWVAHLALFSRAQFDRLVRNDRGKQHGAVAVPCSHRRHRPKAGVFSGMNREEPRSDQMRTTRSSASGSGS